MVLSMQKHSSGIRETEFFCHLFYAVWNDIVLCVPDRREDFLPNVSGIEFWSPTGVSIEGL